MNHLRSLVNDLKSQLGQMDINQTVDSHELQKIIGEQKNVRFLFFQNILREYFRNWVI